MTVRNVRAAHPNGLAVEAQIGTGGDAVLKSLPNTREQQLSAEVTIRAFSNDRDDYVALMRTVFAPPRPPKRKQWKGTAK